MLKRIMFVMLFAIVVSSGLAQSLNLEDQVKEVVLDNGLKILMVERHEIPRVVCHMYFKAGGVYERPGITGISHFLEHMLFKGTEKMGVTDFDKDDELNRKIDALMAKIYKEKYWKRNGDQKKIAAWEAEADMLMQEEKQVIIKDDLWELYMKNGGTGLNASTGTEITGYYVTLPSNKVELQMWLESDRMLNPVFREFYSEKEVVREERRLSENRPGYLFSEQLRTTFYGSSPYQWGVIGWDEDLKKVTKADMIAYHKKYYAPNNAVAVYVGDIDPDEIIAMASEYFGRIPRGPEPEPVRTMAVAQYCEKRLYGEAEAPSQVSIKYHVPPAGHPDDEVFDVISGLMNGRTGRLYKTLVREKGIAISASGYGGGDAYAGDFTFSSRPKSAAGHTCEEIEAALYDEIEKLKSEPVSDYELEKVKNQAEAGFIRGLRSSSGLASRLGRSELYLGWRNLTESLENMKKVTAEDVMRVANKYFVKDNRTVGILKRTSSRKQS